MNATARRMRAFLIAAICALGATSPASAQDDATLEAARRLVAVSKIEQNFKPLVDIVTEQMRPLLRQQAPRLTDEQLREYETAFEDEMRTIVPEMMAFFSRTYAQAFTRDELEALTAFYETPVGQKALDLLPMLAQQGMAAGMKIGREVSERAARKAAERMRAKGYDL